MDELEAQLQQTRQEILRVQQKLKEANESQEDSTVLGQSSRRLHLSRETSGEAYR